VDHALLSIDRAGTIAKMYFDAIFGVPFLAGEHQLFSIAMREERCQADAVVRGAGLFAEGDDAEASIRIELNQSLAETLADHPVANDDNIYLLGRW
jgi:hypothetical protein